MNARMKLLACVFALCMALGLAACGGGSSNSGSNTSDATNAADTAKTDTAETAVDPMAAWVGSWDAYGVELNGAVMTGDIAALNMTFGLNLMEDSTFTMTMNGEDYQGTWEVLEDGSAVASDVEGAYPMVMADDGTMVMTVTDDGTTIAIHFYKDGQAAPAITYNPASATKITDGSALAGKWDMVAMVMNGVCVEGNFAALGNIDMTVSFAEDGTAAAVFNGESVDMTWSVDDNGAMLVGEGGTMPLAMLGDKLVVNLSDTQSELYLILGM